MHGAWKISGLAVCGALMAFAAFTAKPAPTGAGVAVPDLVPLRLAAFHYRASGDFTHDGRPVRAPVVTAVMRPLAVMRHQVTAAEYWRCVDAGACPTIDRDASAADRPVWASSCSWPEQADTWTSTSPTRCSTSHASG